MSSASLADGGSVPAVAPVFASIDGGARWVVTGALTFATATDALAKAKAQPLPTSGVVDCSGIVVADSAGLAVLLALQRWATSASRPLSFVAGPPVLATLADLYGVEPILGV